MVPFVAKTKINILLPASLSLFIVSLMAASIIVNVNNTSAGPYPGWVPAQLDRHSFLKELKTHNFSI